MVERPQSEVHFSKRQSKIELILTLRQTVCVGRRLGAADVRWQTHGLRQCVDLRLIKMRNRLDIGRPVAAFYEEALIIFKSIRCSDNSKIKPIRMKIF